MIRAIQLFPICYLFVAISSGQSVLHLKTGDVETDPAATVTEITSPMLTAPDTYYCTSRDTPPLPR